MFGDIKALVVVLAVAAMVFAVAKPLCAGHVEQADFKRRRNVWFVLTILGFVSPSIWVYAAIAMPVMYLAGKRDSNPLALYVLLMFVIPNVGVYIPVVGINQLFDLNHTRMMSIAILIPAVLRRRGQSPRPAAFGAIDWVLLAYLALQVVLFVPYESPTNTLRRALLLFLDFFIVFYAFSRGSLTRKSLSELLVTGALMGGLLAPLALFESVRGWLLYLSISGRWGVPGEFAWLQRGESLRAQVSTGHSLVLGYTLSLAIGCWLYLQSQRPRSWRDAAVSVILCLGLFSSYSRGAWLMAMLVFVVYLALRPGSAGFFAKVLPVIALLGVIAYLSPLKELVIDRLPIVGTADQDTINYRRQLAEVSWRLIQVHPFLGDPFVTSNMEELRQGQGIIDIINGYIAVTLYHGFVGLTLFVSIFLLALTRCFLAMRACVSRDTDLVRLGGALCAVMVGSLFFIATAGVGPIEYLWAGLMTSYAAIAIPRAVGGRYPRSASAPLRHMPS